MPQPPATIDEALQRFGLSEFRPGQREVIESIVRGDNSLCVMPTGGGKSLCYQLPAIVRPGLTIVVSPLIALMKDQVDRLRQLGIPAALVNSTLSHGEQESRLQDVASGKYNLVYVAPERLRNSRFLEAIRATPIQLLAIDEAHCISQWGHDFRPDYTRIGKFREWLGGIQTVALTATATPRVREDIVSVLGLERPKQFMSGFARPNLHFGVVSCKTEREKDDELQQFLKRQNGAGIIYSATRKRCDALVAMIQKETRLSVGVYHAGLMPQDRKAVQERFMRGELQVIVATNAFGMGIDKSDLRYVIHYNMPGSLEAYYQEAGRAGRDGLQSQCVLLYTYQDRYIQEFFIENNYPTRQTIASVYEFLCSREEDPIELTLEEIRDHLGLNVSPESIGSALQVLGRTEVLQRLEMGGGMAMVRIDSKLPSLVDLLPKEAKIRRQVLRMLERVVGDRRGEEVSVHPRWMLQQSGLQRDTLNRALREIGKLEPIDYIPPFRGRAIHFRRHGVPFNELNIDFEGLQKRKEAEMDRLNHVVQYAQSPLCRQSTILKYFGDQSPENCGRCDRCGRQPGWPRFAVDESGNAAAANNASADSARAVQMAEEQKADRATVETEHAGEPNGKGAVKESAPVAALAQVLDAIERIHGRLGKILIAQYLCGSQNAKVQKLNLHRLSGFGLLKSCKQAEAAQLLDAMLAAGVLRQQEVNRNRPTVSVAPQLTDANLRRETLANVNLTPSLVAKLRSLTPRASSEPRQQTAPTARPEPQQRASDADIRDTKLSEAKHGELVRADRQTPPASAARSDQASEAAKAPSGGSHSGATSSSVANENRSDWKYTVRLFEAGFTWQEVRATRRMTEQELCASLAAATENGAEVKRAWLASGEDITAEQQRLIRHLQRRKAAGIRSS